MRQNKIIIYNFHQDMYAVCMQNIKIYNNQTICIFLSLSHTHTHIHTHARTHIHYSYYY